MSLFKRPKWQVNPTALSKACKILDLRHSVTISVPVEEESFWWGTYEVYPLHAISVNPTMPKRKISLTIWHELGHAMQCERDFNSDGDAFLSHVSKVYEPFMTMSGEPTWDEDQEDYEDWRDRWYEQLPMEREAEDIALKYAKRHPLIS